jgi:hypothetical protein
LITSILIYLTQLAIGIVSQIKAHGAALPAEILKEVNAGLTALQNVHGSLVTLQQAESLRTSETWPDPVTSAPLENSAGATIPDAVTTAHFGVQPGDAAKVAETATPTPPPVAAPTATEDRDQENPVPGNGNPERVVE